MFTSCDHEPSRPDQIIQLYYSSRDHTRLNGYIATLSTSPIWQLKKAGTSSIRVWIACVNNNLSQSISRLITRAIYSFVWPRNSHSNGASNSFLEVANRRHGKSGYASIQPWMFRSTGFMVTGGKHCNFNGELDFQAYIPSIIIYRGSISVSRSPMVARSLQYFQGICE